ncbi:hypothetical protein ACYKS1_27420, partial [Klebsiella pneumoniae]|nr:hypothetical protein [Klebsiella pneumoniae]MCO0311772.1 hypothetical protein [Klebsiella pneumoniae]MCO0649267.1 hypothetical protein [Klebsiella pneumoniae]MCQ5448101.1 hypothetical protein [Klebsiella pneumoniae]MCQ5468796.1 hypothetical protein [Klebsiella pneumoniae]
VCGKKIGPDPRNFNQRVSLGRNDLLIRTFPNAQTFYEKHGFKLMQESMYPSALAQAELRCMEMSINLLG